MFWSPAVMTLSVVVWAPTAPAKASPASKAKMRRFIGVLLVGGLNRLGIEQQQRVARHDHASRRALGDALGCMHPDLGAAGTHAVAVALPHVDRLRDDTLQTQIAVAGGRCAVGEPSGVAAEMRADARAARRAAR